MDAAGQDSEQGEYQVRLDWGVAGLGRLAASDIIVVVDVLDPFSDGLAAESVMSAADAPLVLRSGIQDAAGVAERILREQGGRGARTSIAVIAVGDPPRGRELDPDAPLRFAVEDLLGAGAVVDALGAAGIDHTSPAAASAGEAFRALRGGLRHLLAATPAGRALHAAGRSAEVTAATG